MAASVSAMTLYTDDPRAATTLLPVPAGSTPTAQPEEDLAPVVEAVFRDAAAPRVAPLELPGWRAVLVRDHAVGSQFDLLVDLVRGGVRVPDGVACLARTGSGMHGFRGRPWSAVAGNIHLVVHLTPNRPVERFESAFTALAAVSAAEAADAVLGGHGEAGGRGRAGIKWVNDVIVAGRKVGGVLAYTQTRDAVVTSVVLGIGLNVEATPDVERSPFVPAAGCLREVAAAPGEDMLQACTVALLAALRRNHDALLAGGAGALISAYRERSVVLGRRVTVEADEVGVAGGMGDANVARELASGRVTAIGDGLELYLDGRPEPVTRGRLRFDDA